MRILEMRERLLSSGKRTTYPVQEDIMVQLTAREKAILLAMPSFQYTQDDEFRSGSGAWGWSLVDDITGVLGCSLRSAKGNVASLTNKGIFDSSFDPEYKSDGHWVYITDAGFAIYEELVAETVNADHEAAVVDSEATEAEEGTVTAEPTLEAVAAAVERAQGAEKLTARQRVQRDPEGGWIILGTTEHFDQKRPALRRAAELNR